MSSPLDLIRLSLVELVDDMNGDSPDNVDSQAAATNICSMALSDLKEDEMDMATSLLFNPEKGILYFLKKALDRMIHTGAKTTFLEFTAEFISRFPKSVASYIIDIKKTCLTLFLNDSSARVKRSAMLPIKFILTSCNRMIDPEALDISGLFEKLFTAYGTQQSKMASTVKAEVLEVLGVVSRHFPKVAEERCTVVLRWYLSAIQDQLKPGGKQELSFIAGAVGGLDSFLYSFADKASKDVPTILHIIKTLVNVPEDLTRFATPVAALELFSNHIHLFRTHLINSYEWLYQRIAAYCEHSHPGMSSSGYKALDVFLQEIANVLTTSKTTEREYNCFLYFTANFTQIISTEVITSTAQYKAMSVAIRGYGYFAAPCKQIAPDLLKNLLSQLLRKSSFLVSSNTAEGTDRSSTHLAAFITAYTFVAKVYDEIPELLMTALNQMADAAVVNFTKMSTYARIDCTVAIERLLIMLFHKSEGVLRGFIEKLTYKLLVFTSADIARPKATSYRGNEQSTQDTAWHSYTIYLFLWRNLFKPTSLSKELNRVHEEISIEELEKFLRIVYGSTMESFKRLVTLLNLSVSDSEMDLDDGPSLDALQVQSASDSPTGPASGDIAKMQANCAKDFIIFQNLTEFWQIFLPEIHPDLFARWAFVIGDTLIDLSARHPLVSGFYKMFATCLQVCQSISLFAGAIQTGPVFKAEDEMVDTQRAAALFRKYIREVLARLEQYKDDLLASCLHLVLSSPSALTDSTSIIAPIQLALKLGLGYFPLASIGLDAIERWIDIVNGDQDSWFGRVLPPLNDYLMVQVTSVDEKDEADTFAVKSKKRIPSPYQTYKAVARRAFLLTSPEQIQSLRDLQLRILKLLGRQAQHNKLILEGQLSQQDGANKVSSDLLAWDPEPRVKLKIPFQEMKTELQLDEMLPRIVDLAENSLNRQIKVASCELLHSLVILMVGSSAFRARDAQDPKKSPFHKIYLKVFPALLRLAVDVDQVSRSLYRPLVSQLIHWLTNGAQYENPETIALLSCCMDAACDTLGPLRDFGAECLGEFVKWSVKQTATSASSSVNVKSLLKRVYNLASHSNPAKRLGAALIVNRIYRVFREETPLVNQFTMELLYWMLFSLKLAEADHAGLGTRQQSRMAITHLQRIISVKAALFLKDSKDRRRIPGLEAATLDSLVQWLLSETARTEVEYTQVCRALFDSFVTLLPHNHTPGSWMGSKLSLDSTFLSSTYAVVQHGSGTFSQPTVYQRWCSQLASTLTNCIWLLSHQGSSDLLVTQLEKTMVFAAAAKFLEKCLLFSTALAKNQMTTPLTASERMQIMDQNFLTARKVFSFVSRLVSRSIDRGERSLVQELKSSGLLGSKLFSVFAVCLFNPDSIGNDELLKSEEEKMALNRELEASLKSFSKLSADDVRSFGSELIDTISSDDLNPLAVSPDIKGQDPIKSKAVLDGIELVQRCSLLEIMFYGSSKEANQYIESLHNTFMRMQETQDPLWIDYCSSLLRLSLAERQSRHGLWEYLLDSKNADAAKMTYLKYSGEINRQLAIHFSDLSPLLSQSAKSSPLLLDIWTNFLDYLFSHPELTKEREGFLDMLTKDFSALESIVESLGKDQVTTIIALWKRLVALSPRILRMSKSTAFVSYFFKIYQGFFERDTEKREYLTLPIMSEAFPILPVFLSYPGSRTAEFESVFNRAIMNMLPMSSMEYERGSTRFKDYIAALDLILKAVVLSSSINLFKTLMGVAIRESNHPHMEEIQRFISSFALKLPLSKFLEVARYCFDEFLKRTHSDEHRRNIVHQILLPILKTVPPLSVTEFYVLHIVKIMGVLKQDPPRSTDVDIRRDYIERGCCYDLIHVLYMRLPSELVNTKDSRIVNAFAKGKAATGKELTVEVFRTANAAKFKQDANSLTPEAAALRDDFKRAAYNALAAAILRTQRKEDFFRQFLFRDNEVKKEFVWENIVDLTVHYHFEQILSGPLVKSRLSDLRSKSLNPNKTYNSKYQYLSSQYLRDSSLSQSVGVLDDNVYVDQESDSRDESDGSSEAELMTDPIDLSKAAEVKNEDRRLEPEQTLELDAINSNPCMKMILLIIKELHSSITPPPKEMAKEESTMPSWMKDVYRKLTNPNTALNIRLFLAKMIINMPEAFEMYAYSWIRPLMRLAIEGESYGEAMNYFVRDLCVLIVVWGESVKLADVYADRVLLLSFMTYLMKHCHHEQRQYLKDNIDLIKGVFENWSNIAIVPTTVIYNNFKSIKDDKTNVTGIQLLGIVLTHDNPPFYKGPEIDLSTLNEEEYYQTLVRNMGSSHKPVYTSTAEVCGLVLAYMKRHNVLIEEFQELVTRKLFELLVPSAGSGSRSKSGNVVVHFLNSLHKVQLNYPEITDTFGPRILFLFPQLLGEERALALEILAGRAAYLPDLFQSLQGLNFLGCLRHRDEATQFAALSILYGLWESLEASQIMYFLDTLVLEFSSHSSMECRKLYYSILMVLFDKQADTPMVAGVLRTQLLCGLGDSSESIRHTIVEFWYDKNRLPADTFLRLQELVGNMYDTQAEDKFLSYATYMLLDRTKKSFDYTEPIFADPLPNAKFSDSYANIDTSWRNTAAMTPLFVPTQQSLSQDMRRQGTLGDDELRATQSTFDFSMTLDGGAPGIRSQLGGTANSSSTLLFRSNSMQDSGIIDSSQQSVSTASQKYRGLQHRRVATDQMGDVQRFKRAWETKMNTRMQAVVDKENARAKSVSMIRKYRDGDLPDIQISYSDIIRPLQSLAELDVEICRMLFSKLVTGLMAQADSYIEVGDDAISFKNGLVDNLRRMLERSTALFAPFIGCILRICHDYGEADVPAELISKVAIRSSNQHLGIILLEKQIQHLEPKERSAKRQKTGAPGQHDPKQHSWNELARVYKSIDEKDVYKSICESRVASKELDYTARAIEAEVLGDYGRAAEVYFEAIDKYYSQEIEIDEIERGIWAQGRLECLEYLGEWNNLEANMMADLDNDPREIWSEDYQDPYLHFYLTTYLKLVDGKEEDGMLTAWSSENPNPLFRFIDRAMNNPAHRQVLTTQFQPELALAALLGKDYKQASHFVRQSYERFLSIWSNLHPLSTWPRLHELAGLQRIVELEEFLDGIDTVLRSSTNDPFLSLLSKWERRYPGKTTDTMVTWHNVLDDRSLMIRRLEEHVPYSRKQEILVKKHRIHNLLKLSAAAREQGNFLVAENCITSMQGLTASAYDMYASQLKLNLTRADIELDRSRKADLLMDTLTNFEERLTNTRESDPSQLVSLQLLGSKAYGQLRDLIADDKGVLEHVGSSAWAQSVLAKNPRASIPQELQHRGYNCLQTAATVETGEKMAKKLRLTTASYCDKILRHYESEDKGSPALNDKYLDLYAHLVVKNTLKSMQDEETGATELFPRLLQIIEIYPSSQKPFTELVTEFTGCWTFVRWIQQLVAVLDKPIGACVMPILSAIAQQYPNALYYPLTISSENFTFENSSSGQKRKADVATLKKAVYSPLKEDFIFELRRLTNPDHLLKDWLEQTVALFQSKTRNAEQVVALYQDLHRLVLDVNNPRLGSIAKAFAAKHGAKLESFCGKSGQRLATISNKDFNAHVIKYCRSEILNKDIPKKHGEGDLLKSYSPWLNSFQSTDHEGVIDIPGQHTGLTPPHGQQMATIVRFDQRVLAMSSIRKPKRISILGSDEKEHLFLVKGGEDLRLDQRIQQLFSLMNDIMHKDPQCSQQNISVATYKVVPMSGSLGILEWVDNTKPLRHCIEGEVSPKDSWKRTQEQHNRFVASFKGDMMGYYNLFMHAPREKVVKHMESLFSQMRDDCLKQSVARLAASPEAFLMLRSEFAKSLAAINVCSYILGIGDRHLENFLLDMSNGCLIPIDFGHAFGSATEVLPVPELVPFRLTRQLEGFLKPLGIKGLLEHPMVCIMKALQSKKEVILNTMDIFVKEPLLDWRSHALKQAREQHKRGANMESFEIDENSVAPPAWYLQQKIDIARKKLEGYNPSHLTVRELTSGHLNKPYLPALTKIALGDKKHNVRARHGEVCAGVQAQVECLIDMAMDSDLLGRTWVGWSSWI